MTEDEKRHFPVVELQRARSIWYSEILQQWQREHFARLDRAEALARQRGIGLDLIHQAFGRVLTPGLPTKAYDAAELLDLPRKGTATDPIAARERLAPLFELTPEPPFPLEQAIRASQRR